MAPDQSDESEVRHTTDPTLARTVIEERNGYPAHVPGSEDEPDHGLLRVGFRDRDEDLKEISWEQFREEFEDKELAALYRDDEGVVDENRPVVLEDRETAVEQSGK
ncbi:hypothetical protein ACFQMA_25245 [Halosimplex aquaticum]|uniref:Uncharacterized protein n=1 Tax=Halosimplex aquaticum TaxID=3026162 RepID=A0ABD5YAV9_9EURY